MAFGTRNARSLIRMLSERAIKEIRKALYIWAIDYTVAFDMKKKNRVSFELPTGDVKIEQVYKFNYLGSIVTGDENET